MKAEVVLHKGKPMISINGTLFQPVSFRSFRPEEKTVKAFDGAGIRLMSVFPSGINCSLGVPYSQFGEIWTGQGQYDFGVLERQIRLFTENAPDAYLSLMIHMDTRDWWLEKHPDYKNSFTHLSAVAGDPLWREGTGRYMRDIISWVEGNYGDRFYAYFLFCGSTCEWFTIQDDGHYDPVKERAFRAYMEDEKAELPLRPELHNTSHGVFRDPVHNREALTYWRFHNEVVADTILHFAAQVKEWTHREKLTGVFYGYLGILGSKILQRAHLAYEKVFASPDIDIIFAPADYMLRRYGCTGAFLQTVDSISLNRKLYFHEIDNTTHIAPEPYVTQLSRAHYRPRSEHESIAVMRREFIMATVKGTGLWWFDMFGGWFDSPALMGEIARMREITTRLHEIPLRTVSRVAVFADPESMYYLDANGTEGTSLISRQRESLGRMGTPYDFYTLSDLFHPEFPGERYRLYVFLNPFTLPAELRSYVKREVTAKGRSVLWMYAPGYVTSGGLSVDGISGITGIEFRELPNSESHSQISPGSPLNPTDEVIRYGFDDPVKPVFTFNPDGLEVTGTYTKSEMPSGFVKKEEGGGYVFFSGTANLPTVPMRETAKRAGAWIYCRDGLPFYCCNRLLGIHVPESGVARLHLPADMEVEELFDGGTYASRNRILTVRADPGTVKLFMTPSDIETGE